jgi:hypothetical protein
MKPVPVCSLLLAMLLAADCARGDVESGPAAGSDVSPFKTFAVEGEAANETVNFVERREGKPTLYVFIPAEKWSRPTARLLRKMDESIDDAAPEAKIVAVWLTSDGAAAKEYLPKAQQSLKLANTALTVYEENATGPGEWGVNSEADVTVVATRGGKVLKSYGIVSANETLADEILKALKP